MCEMLCVSGCVVEGQGTLYVESRTVAMSTVEELRSKKRALDIQLASVSIENKRLRMRMRADAKAWRLEGRVLHVALAAYFYSGSTVPGTNYLRRVARERRWQARCDDVIAEMIMTAFVTAGVGVILALVDECDCSDADALVVAQRYVLEWHACCWARDQNLKAITPSSRDILYKVEVLRSEIPVAIRPPPWGVMERSSGRQKVLRWRRSFGGRHGRFPIRDVLPAQDVHDKVVYVACIAYCSFSFSYRRGARGLLRFLHVAAMVADCMCRCTCEAVASWQWWNYYESQIPTAKTPLRINMDETAVCLFQGAGAGAMQWICLVNN